MQARISKMDLFYRVTFARPAFSQVTTFAKIIEPIHDAFSHILPDASSKIELKLGNSISSSSVVLNHHFESGFSLFEAKLDGYEVSIHNVPSLSSIDHAVKNTKLFETAVRNFLNDCHPKFCLLGASSWLAFEDKDSVEKSEQLISNLTSYAECQDPFDIGASKLNASVQFDCHNDDEKWLVRIKLEKSELPGSHLFYQISGVYQNDSQFNSMDKQIEHLSVISDSVTKKVGFNITG